MNTPYREETSTAETATDPESKTPTAGPAASAASESKTPKTPTVAAPTAPTAAVVTPVPSNEGVTVEGQPGWFSFTNDPNNIVYKYSMNNVLVGEQTHKPNTWDTLLLYENVVSQVAAPVEETETETETKTKTSTEQVAETVTAPTNPITKLMADIEKRPTLKKPPSSTIKEGKTLKPPPNPTRMNFLADIEKRPTLKNTAELVAEEEKKRKEEEEACGKGKIWDTAAGKCRPLTEVERMIALRNMISPYDDTDGDPDEESYGEWEGGRRKSRRKRKKKNKKTKKKAGGFLYSKVRKRKRKNKMKTCIET